ncbi:MAG TPA: glutathione binding-like protein, partial [Paracoccaceae bacterium]|nr:glutathione binding-like protein [Paracoccaceae bacterium]
ETRRLLSVLEGRLAGRDWIMGEDYTVADVATWPWVRVLGGFYDAAERLGLDDYPRVGDWLERATARPASKAAVEIPGKD